VALRGDGALRFVVPHQEGRGIVPFHRNEAGNAGPRRGEMIKRPDAQKPSATSAPARSPSAQENMVGAHPASSLPHGRRGQVPAWRSIPRAASSCGPGPLPRARQKAAASYCLPGERVDARPPGDLTRTWKLTASRPGSPIAPRYFYKPGPNPGSAISFVAPPLRRDFV